MALSVSPAVSELLKYRMEVLLCGSKAQPGAGHIIGVHYKLKTKDNFFKEIEI